MARRPGQLVEEVRRPGEQVPPQVLVEVGGPVAGEPRHEGQHEADVVLGLLLLAQARDAAPAHPRAQLERRRAEHHALAVGVHGPPRRGRLGRGAHEQAAVLPREAVVARAACEAGDHEPQRLARLALLREGPLRGGVLGVERGDRLEGRPRAPGQGVLQEERGERVAREGDGVEHRVCLLVHAIVPFARFDETRLIKQKRIVHCSAPRLSAALRARYERAAYGKCQRRQSALP